MTVHHRTGKFNGLDCKFKEKNAIERTVFAIQSFT